MKASIIISVSSNKILFDNFLFHLSKYKTINEYQIIFANDNTDFQFDEKYIHKYSINNVKVLEFKEKLGYGAANNKAADHAICDFLIFINDDIILKDGCLEILISALNDKKIGAVQPKLIYPQNNTIQSTGHIFTRFSNSHAFENLPSSSPITNKSMYRIALTTAVCATRRDLFLSMDKFDLSYYNAWEGMEYTLKLTMNGYKCLYEHQAEAYHIRGGARGLYSLDEDYQTALFWSRWSEKIEYDLPNYLSDQLTNQEINQQYLLINFSRITNAVSVLNSCNIRVENEITHTFNSGMKYIDFFKCLPTTICQTKLNIIYFCNNFAQVKNNIFWFELRKNYKDLIIDLCGNVIRPI